MQSVLAVLFPFLVLFYLMDCIIYLRPNHRLFVSILKNRFTYKRSGIHVLGLLPHRESIVSHNLPFLIAERGVYLFDSGDHGKTEWRDSQYTEFVPYDQIEAMTPQGKIVRFNRHLSLTAPSSAAAKAISESIEGIRCIDRDSRSKYISSLLRDSFDVVKLKSLRKRHDRILLPIRAVSTLLFIEIFILMPILTYAVPANRTQIFSLLVGIAITYILTIALALFVYQKIHENSVKSAFRSLLPVILSPVTAAHIVKDITRDLYPQFHYLAIAAVLLPRNEFADLARVELQRAGLSAVNEENADFGAAWRSVQSELQDLLSALGVRSDEIFAAPVRQDPNAASYCPVCRVEYRPGFNACEDCSVELNAFG